MCPGLKINFCVKLKVGIRRAITGQGWLENGGLKSHKCT